MLLMIFSSLLIGNVRRQMAAMPCAGAEQANIRKPVLLLHGGKSGRSPLHAVMGGYVKSGTGGVFPGRN